MTDDLRARVARAMMERGHPDRDWSGLANGSREVFLEYADAALSVSPWLPIPPVPVEGMAPWDGTEYLLGVAGTHTRRIGNWMWLNERSGVWMVGGNLSSRLTHYQPIAPLPAAPTGEGL